MNWVIRNLQRRSVGYCMVRTLFSDCNHEKIRSCNNFLNTVNKLLAADSLRSWWPLSWSRNCTSLWNLKVHNRVYKNSPSRSVGSNPRHISIISILILSFHLRLCLTRSLFHLVFQLKCCMLLIFVFFLSFLCGCMSRSFHLPLCVHPNNIWWSLQIMKLLVIHFSPSSYRFLPFRSKYSP
jgi:hypothetical protein